MLIAKSFIFSIVLLLSVVSPALALEIPKPEPKVFLDGLTAKSYIVLEKNTGEVLASRDEDMQWVPASLTKLVSAMVVLDMNPKLSGKISFLPEDEVGGAKLNVKRNGIYKVSDLFYAGLIASQNNSINALARSTGLAREKFVEKMNQKVSELGAEHTFFTEPTGISEFNTTTAKDFAKIALKAFSYPQIEKASSLKNFSFSPVNLKKGLHKVTNTNKLLGDSEVTILGAKTGYLEESLYNFTALAKGSGNSEVLLVLLGSKSPQTQFTESKKLIVQSTGALAFLQKIPFVLGVGLKNNN